MSNKFENREEILTAVEIFKRGAGQGAMSHSGVKGMKWGIWNDETKRKYGVGSAVSKGKKAAQKAAKAIKSSVRAKGAAIRKAPKATVDSLKAKASAKRQRAAEDRAQAKELGMKKKDFEKLRETTLKSHDPSVVAKGMHTLTDAELDAKLKRLTTESKLANLGYTREQTAAITREKKYEAIKKSPVYDILASPVKDVTKSLIVDTLSDKGFKPVLEQRTEHYAKKAMDEFSKKHPQGEEPSAGSNQNRPESSGQSSKPNTSSAKPSSGPATQKTSKESAQQKASDQSARTAKPKYEVPKGAEKVYREKASKSKNIEAEVIEVIPADVRRVKISTANRKALPAGRG